MLEESPGVEGDVGAGGTDADGDVGPYTEM